MYIELVEHTPGHRATGIGRYTYYLHRHLAQYPEHLSIRLTGNSDPVLAHRFTTLHHLPVGVQQHQPGSIVHFQQIMGCSQMLWNPTRPALATVHDLGVLVWPDEWKMIKPVDRMILWLSLQGLRRMDRLIAVSAFTRNMIIEHLKVPPDRVHTVHSGIDHELFCPISDARQQLSQRYGLSQAPSVQYILYTGSELPRKNIKILLRALALVRQQEPAVQLIKVGKANGARFREQTIQIMQELGLTEAVHFYEDVPDSDLPLFYSAADVYVQPSFLEGFGFPVLEAMACGTPVVCSTAGSLPEIAGNAARFFAPDDAQACATQVLELLGSRQLQEQMIEQGRARAAAFTWEQAALATLAVYRRVRTKETR
jgi:glycosyltransferase involved in cell wall biosynthesis